MNLENSYYRTLFDLWGEYHEVRYASCRFEYLCSYEYRDFAAGNALMKRVGASACEGLEVTDSLLLWAVTSGVHWC